MTNGKWLITTILCVLASFSGSFVFNKVFVAEDNKKTDQKNMGVVVASEFRVVDANGVVKATFGMRKESTNEYIPSLRLLTKAYGSESGILLEASDNNAMVNLYGDNANVAIDVTSSDNGSGTSKISVESRQYPDILGKDLKLLKNSLKEKDSSRIEICSGVNSHTKMVLYDTEDRTRAILGHVSLEEKNTGALKEFPVSLAFFDKNGLATWKLR